MYAGKIVSTHFVQAEGTKRNGTEINQSRLTNKLTCRAINIAQKWDRVRAGTKALAHRWNDVLSLRTGSCVFKDLPGYNRRAEACPRPYKRGRTIHQNDVRTWNESPAWIICTMKIVRKLGSSYYMYLCLRWITGVFGVLSWMITWVASISSHSLLLSASDSKNELHIIKS